MSNSRQQNANPEHHISLITTVFNEGEAIHHLMQGVQAQHPPPHEFVIVDGGSTDNTVAIIREYCAENAHIRLIEEDGCNISEGRNFAINAAQGDIIAVTDAGVRMPAHWLATITAPLLQPDAPSVAAGFFYADPDPHNPFEVAMSATVLPQLDEIDPSTFLPSSRSVAFTKAAWQAVGGYPEWLDYSEDLIFDLRLKMVSDYFAFVGDAYVHFKPRTSLNSYFKQYYLYARGDGKANLWRKRHAIRYITYLVVAPIVAALGLLVHPLLWSLYIVGGIIYLRQPLTRLPRLWNHLTAIQKLYALLLVPLIRVWGDVAKMMGYPVGWRWRLKHNPPDWRQL